MTCPDIFLGAGLQYFMASPVATLGSQFRFHSNKAEPGIPKLLEASNLIRGRTLVLSSILFSNFLIFQNICTCNFFCNQLFKNNYS